MKSIAGTMVVALVLSWISCAEAKPLPTWDQVINGPGRFKVLNDFNGDAVYDKETGLVWEKAPDIAVVANWGVFPSGAVNRCLQRAVGGRMGWRLPTAEELFSLIDASQTPANLPAGHPFININADPTTTAEFYWSVTTSAEDPAYAIGIGFNAANIVSLAKTGGSAFVWCVRGGHGHDGQ